jgi:hypothetical protein
LTCMAIIGAFNIIPPGIDQYLLSRRAAGEPHERAHAAGRMMVSG